MKSPQHHKKSKSPRLIMAAIILVAVGLLAWAGYSFYRQTNVNYAEEVTKPIEAALTKAGATKVCSTGDTGRGPDNREPWYTTYFETTKDFTQAKELAIKATTEDGYKVSQAPQGVKGYLGDIVYIDSHTKMADVDNLKNGSTELSIALNNSGELHGCSPKTVSSDASHTAITLELRLPSFK